MIPYGRQHIDDADVQAVLDVLRSDFLTQGPAVPRFEAAVAQATGGAHVVAFNSATSALHAACIALGLGPGDWLWTTPNTFVASANCGLYCGARVDFVDIDPRTYCMDAGALERKLEATPSVRRPKIVVPVHFGGCPCDMVEIRGLAERFGFRTIEDASHAIGASYRGRPIGDCSWSDVCVFSYHPVKIVTTGEGGTASTRDPEIAWRMQTLRTHGITREPERMTRPSPGAWYYEQLELGFNYRMTDIHAALGASQVAKVERFVQRRTDLAARYDELLDSLPVRRPCVGADRTSAWHLYVVRLAGRDRVFERMRAAGIGVNVHYIPVHLQPHYRALGFREGDFPEAERYAQEALSLPLFFDLTESEQDQIATALAEALG